MARSYHDCPEKLFPVEFLHSRAEADVGSERIVVLTLFASVLRTRATHEPAAPPLSERNKACRALEYVQVKATEIAETMFWFDVAKASPVRAIPGSLRTVSQFPGASASVLR